VVKKISQQRAIKTQPKWKTCSEATWQLKRGAKRRLANWSRKVSITMWNAVTNHTQVQRWWLNDAATRDVSTQTPARALSYTSQLGEIRSTDRN